MRAKGRTALITAMVAMPVAGAAVVLVLLASAPASTATITARHLGPQAQAELVWTGVGAIEQDPVDLDRWTSATDAATGALTAAQVEQLVAGSLPTGTDVERVARVPVSVATTDRQVSDLVGLERASIAGLDYLAPVERGVAPVGTRAVMLSYALAERLGVDVGATVTVTSSLDQEPLELTVTGLTSVPDVVVTDAGTVLSHAGVSSPDDVDPATTAMRSGWLRWLALGPDPVGWDTVTELNAAGVFALSRAVLADPPPVPSSVAAMQIGTTPAEVAQLGAVVAFAVLEAVLLIGPAFAVGARRSERQLALIAASGGDRATLRRVVLMTGWVTGALGAAAGAVVGTGLAVAVRAVVRRSDPWAFADLRVPFVQLAAAAAFGVLVAVVAAWLPARRAARMDVVAALAGRRGQPTLRRRVPVLGLVLAGSGVVGAAVGAIASVPVAMIGGTVLLIIGTVASAGGVVTALATVAGRLGPAWRFALRDAARQRARTAPAVGAVLVAIGGVVAMGGYAASVDAVGRASYDPLASPGVVAVVTDPGAADEMVQDLAGVLHATLPIDAVHDVVVAGVEPALLAEVDAPRVWIDALIDPEACAGEVGDGGDPRCVAPQRERVVRNPWHPDGEPLLVDDGTVVAALGLPQAEQMRAALASGALVVTDPAALWPDGTAHLAVTVSDAVSGEVTYEGVLQVPAVLVESSRSGPVLAPAALGDLGLVPQREGLVATTTRMPTQAEEDAAAAAISRLAPAGLIVERGYSGDGSLLTVVLIAVAVVVGLGATGIAVALGASESRPDMATLAAVGAGPRTRRRVAGAQAGIVAGTGTVLGTFAGLAFAWVFALAKRYQGDVPNLDWTLHLPWQVVAGVLGVPLLAALGAAALTRSALPMTRRLAA
ncbi:MAG: FtsX-like permease family protein [Cellulomonadaceae bacterium]